MEISKGILKCLAIPFPDPIGTIAILIALNIIFTLGAPLFKEILPYIFTTHFVKWQYLFDSEIDIPAIKLSLYVQLFYIVLFNVIGIINFKRKDILV